MPTAAGKVGTPGNDNITGGQEFVVPIMADVRMDSTISNLRLAVELIERARASQQAFADTVGVTADRYRTMAHDAQGAMAGQLNSQAQQLDFARAAAVGGNLAGAESAVQGTMGGAVPGGAGYTLSPSGLMVPAPSINAPVENVIETSPDGTARQVSRPKLPAYHPMEQSFQTSSEAFNSLQDVGLNAYGQATTNLAGRFLPGPLGGPASNVIQQQLARLKTAHLFARPAMVRTAEGAMMGMGEAEAAGMVAGGELTAAGTEAGASMLGAAAGIPLAPVAAAIGAAYLGLQAWNWGQQREQHYRGLIGENAGQAGLGGMMNLEWKAKMMALSPLLSEEQAHEIIDTTLGEGYQGQKAKTIIDYIAGNVKEGVLSVKQSIDLYKTAVSEAGATTFQVSTAMSALQRTAGTTDAGMQQLAEQFVQNTGAMAGYGVTGAAAPGSALYLSQAFAYAGNPQVKNLGFDITQTSPLMLGFAAANGIPQYQLPSYVQGLGGQDDFTLQLAAYAKAKVKALLGPVANRPDIAAYLKSTARGNTLLMMVAPALVAQGIPVAGTDGSGRIIDASAAAASIAFYMGQGGSVQQSVTETNEAFASHPVVGEVGSEQVNTLMAAMGEETVGNTWNGVPITQTSAAGAAYAGNFGIAEREIKATVGNLGMGSSSEDYLENRYARYLMNRGQTLPLLEQLITGSREGSVNLENTMVLAPSDPSDPNSAQVLMKIEDVARNPAYGNWFFNAVSTGSLRIREYSPDVLSGNDSSANELAGTSSTTLPDWAQPGFKDLSQFTGMASPQEAAGGNAITQGGVTISMSDQTAQYFKLFVGDNPYGIQGAIDNQNSDVNGGPGASPTGHR